MKLNYNTLGIDIGSTTVKIAILNTNGEIIFSDYQRHYANIQETLASIITDACEQRSEPYVNPCIAKLFRSILQEKVRCWLCFVLKACLHILYAKTHTDNRCKPLCPLDNEL